MEIPIGAEALALAETGLARYTFLRSGSCNSPAVLSPTSQSPPPLTSDFELSSKQDTLGVGLPGTVPDAAVFQHTGSVPLLSPTCNDVPPANPLFDIIHGDAATTLISAIAPTDSPSMTTTPPSHQPSAMSRKNANNLRLPPFELLGIAAPHPDLLSAPRSDLGGHANEPTPDSRCRELRPLCGDEMAGSADAYSVGSRATVHSQQQFSPNPQVPDLLTPPADKSDPISYLETDFARQASLGDGDSSDSTPQLAASNEADQLTPTITDANRPPLSRDITPTALPPSVTEPGDDADADWVDVVARTLLRNLVVKSLSDPVKVLSQALPTPSIPGHHFPEIINALTSSFTPNGLALINLLHAVPGRFNMAEFPTSPPSTPGLAVGEDDYFATRVFESFAFLSSQEEVFSSPHTSITFPAAAPGSMDVAILERYIPPTSQSEFANLFNADGASLLVDRMIELSPKGGCLVFVYPTRTGARTFRQSYLAPILDPCLRSMAVRYDFSSDLSRAIGQMTGVDALFEYDFMHQQVSKLCAQLSSARNGPLGRPSLRSTFTPVYAAAHTVIPDHEVWSKWWVKQEKRRMRAAVESYYGRTVARRSTDSHREGYRNNAERSPTDIVSEIENHIQHPAFGLDDRTEPPIEVGVFVIQRKAYPPPT